MAAAAAAAAAVAAAVAAEAPMMEQQQEGGHSEVRVCRCVRVLLRPQQLRRRVRGAQTTDPP